MNEDKKMQVAEALTLLCHREVNNKGSCPMGGFDNCPFLEKDCEDVLIQIGAAKAALHKAGQSVLEGHLHHCVRDAINEGHGEDALEHLSKAIEQFIKI